MRLSWRPAGLASSEVHHSCPAQAALRRLDVPRKHDTVLQRHAGHLRLRVLQAADPAAAPAPASPPAEQHMAASKSKGLPIPSKDGLVQIGTITGTFGVRGEVKVKVLTADPAQRFLEGASVFLSPPALGARKPGQEQGETIQASIESTKKRVGTKGVLTYVIKLDALDGLEDAAAHHNYGIFTHLGDRPTTSDSDEFYVQDLVGCKVVHQVTGRSVGTVVDSFGGTGTYDTLVVQLRPTPDDIRKSQIRTSMMPFVKVICPVVDLEARIIEAIPPEGLFDINTVRKTRKPLTPEQISQKLQQLSDDHKQEESRVQARAASSLAGGEDAVQPAVNARQEGRPSSSGKADSIGNSRRRKTPGAGVPAAHTSASDHSPGADDETAAAVVSKRGPRKSKTTRPVPGEGKAAMNVEEESKEARAGGTGDSGGVSLRTVRPAIRRRLRSAPAGMGLRGSALLRSKLAEARAQGDGDGDE